MVIPTVEENDDRKEYLEIKRCAGEMEGNGEYAYFVLWKCAGGRGGSCRFARVERTRKFTARSRESLRLEMNHRVIQFWRTIPRTM